MANPTSIMNKMGSFDFLNFSNFSIDKSDDGYIILLRFQNLEMENLETITNESKKDPDIKKIYWSK